MTAFRETLVALIARSNRLVFNRAPLSSTTPQQLFIIIKQKIIIPLEGHNGATTRPKSTYVFYFAQRYATIDT